MKLRFVVLALFFLSIGCRKHQTTRVKPMHVEGYVIATLTGDTIQDAWVTLRRSLTDGGSKYRDFPIAIDSMKVGEDGFFSFDFSADRDIYYALTGVHPKYYSQGVSLPTLYWYASPEGKGYTKENFKDVRLVPFTYLKIHIQNIPPSSATDSLYYRSTFDYSSGYDGSDTIYRIYSSGSVMDTTLIISDLCGYPGAHFWNVYSNGVLISENGSYLSCDPHDTCVYNVFY